MPPADPTERALIRLELRRFATRCEMQLDLIQRADTLREVARLAHLPLPYKLADEYEARDLARRVVQQAEERARQLISEQIEAYARGERDFREKLRGRLREEWSHLTGPLGHLRTWANNKLAAVEQNQ
ncbi:MAG: hypothetical protein N3C63_11260 [Rhodocyclaceae bacterium]|nr:hypothetical protein [Rhodocyclaceae bacterium]